MKRLACLAFGITLSSACFASEELSFDSGSSIVLAGGGSVPMLGSLERRVGGLAGYSTYKIEPFLTRVLGPHTSAVWTFYGMYHVGQDKRSSPDPTLSAGFTYGYRRDWVDPYGKGVGFQLFWGFVAADRNSQDLPSVVNSTPGFVVSWLRPMGAKNFNVGFEYMHVSNAGTTRHNLGENFMLLNVNFLIH